MVEKAVKSLKSKKSFGIDGVPLCIVKDTYQFIKGHIVRLMRLAARNIPRAWKTARIIPLHKQGSKEIMDNYRPISNLCSVDKLFQKVILNEINRRHPDLDGEHQHGFKAEHSTSTAMLEIQSDICSELKSEGMCLLYSVDLSAAFDLLRKRTFYNNLRGVIDDDLLDIVLDFLDGRSFIVEFEGK